MNYPTYFKQLQAAASKRNKDVRDSSLNLADFGDKKVKSVTRIDDNILMLMTFQT